MEEDIKSYKRLVESATEKEISNKNADNWQKQIIALTEVNFRTIDRSKTIEIKISSLATY